MDSSSELEDLNSASESSGDESENPAPQANVARRVRQEYRLLQRFESAEASAAWWEENSKGWMQKSDRSVKSGNQIITYR
jgi:hypothetical protein